MLFWFVLLTEWSLDITPGDLSYFRKEQALHEQIAQLCHAVANVAFFSSCPVTFVYYRVPLPLYKMWQSKNGKKRPWRNVSCLAQLKNEVQDSKFKL